ncbi:ABC transporter permease subunit [Bacillus sp. Marseille-P3800]|uniref:ABC transporter permease subunit n=1 Tax=Bacillus sp. Marseille-P3800 TaxID=2014782 RepID=UPI000C080089|nr:ABC transporter permease subunit [Bacillus sp. Marseille-P3800]
MIRLIQNELMKQNGRVGTWVMLGLIVALTLLTATVVHNAPDFDRFESNWRDNLEADILYYQEFIDEDPFAEEQILLAEYRLSNDLPPAYAMPDSAWTFVTNSNGLLMLVSLFIIAISATIVSSEFKQGTIKLLLVRPPSRIKILLSKYITVLIYMLVFVTTLWLSSLLFGAMFFGFDDQASFLHIVDGDVQERGYGFQSILVFVTHLPMTTLLATLAFAISSMFSSDIMAIAISIASQFLGLVANVMLLEFYDWAILLPFVNDLSQYVTEGGPISSLTSPLFSAIVLIVYWLLFLGLALYVFKKREIKPS